MESVELTRDSRIEAVRELMVSGRWVGSAEYASRNGLNEATVRGWASEAHRQIEQAPGIQDSLRALWERLHRICDKAEAEGTTKGLQVAVQAITAQLGVFDRESKRLEAVYAQISRHTPREKAERICADPEIYRAIEQIVLERRGLVVTESESV